MIVTIIISSIITVVIVILTEGVKWALDKSRCVMSVNQRLGTIRRRNTNNS
ncbi:hypothetical protein LCGC14_2311440 [marine sediment metagenome]|uniref:Uncharacterized protein n=1 Tax=marine sediment metagenome TaxID=412755 RepID=A0A0F9D828_9ZZZZ